MNTILGELGKLDKFKNLLARNRIKTKSDIDIGLK